MHRRSISLLGLGAVLSATLLWLVTAPGAAAGDPCYHDYTLPKDTAAATTTVSLDPCAFAPTLTSVAVGTTVTFRNASPFTHLITGANQAWGSRDAEVAPGATASYAFDRAGFYPYACALHRGMSGVIVVGDAEAIAAAAVGSTSGTTSGTTNGTTTAAAPTTASPVTPTGATDPLPLTALAVVVGIVVGATGAWLVTRRRAADAGSVTAPAS